MGVVPSGGRSRVKRSHGTTPSSGSIPSPCEVDELAHRVLAARKRFLNDGGRPCVTGDDPEISDGTGRALGVGHGQAGEKSPCRIALAHHRLIAALTVTQIPQIPKRASVGIERRGAVEGHVQGCLAVVGLYRCCGHRLAITASHVGDAKKGSFSKGKVVEGPIRSELNVNRSAQSSGSESLDRNRRLLSSSTIRKSSRVATSPKK